jgi:capsular exopolysaccharide synthesis family protein
MFTWEQAVRVLRLRRTMILSVALILIAATVAAAFLLKNVYQPTARIEIDPLEAGIKTLQEIETTNGASDQDYLETQVQILQSEALAMRVIRALHLDRNLEFVAHRDFLKFGQAGANAATNVSAEQSTGFLREQFDLADRSTLEALALKTFQWRLSVSPIRNSRLIEVSFTSHDPQLARLITNTLVTQFIDQNYKTRYSSTMEASDWLSSQLDTLRQNVEKSTQAVADFENQYGLVESEDRDVPMSQLMAEENHQLSDAQATRIEAEAYVRMIGHGQSDSLPALRDDLVYQNLLTRYAELRSQLAQARIVYGDENSNVKRLEGESAEMSSQVEDERARVVNRSLSSLEAARAREKMVMQSRDKLLAQMGAVSSHLMQHQLLKSEVLANAELYNTLRGRLSEAGIYAGLRSSNIHIVDLAPKLITATAPHRFFLITIGTLASCMFALVLAFVLEGFENTVRAPDDVRNWVGLPALAMLPKIDPVASQLQGMGRKDFRGIGNFTAQKRFQNAPLAQSEPIRNLRTSLLLARTEAPPRVVLVSSAMVGEGKTTVAVNLATAFAQRGRTCLLIDADLRRPRISQVFGVAASPGLGDLLNGAAKIETAVGAAPSVPGLFLLTSGRSDSDPTDSLSAERMRLVLEAVKYKFDFIVIDSPPVIPFSDARLIALLADVVVLVARYGYTTRRALTAGVKLFEEIHAPIQGVVVNDIDVKSPDYHYYSYGISRGPGDYPPATSFSSAQENASAKDPATDGESSTWNTRPPDSEANDKSRGAHA